MKIAVLGCGPAGLMATHAVMTSESFDAERDTVIGYSKARKSRMFGAQYLHRPIPGITDRERVTTVDYRMKGSAESYRRKVYGQGWDGTVSPEDLDAQHKAWDIRQAYDTLWDLYGGSVNDMVLDPAGMRILSEMEYDVIINTVPLNMLCWQGHMFRGTEIIAAGDAPELGIEVPYECQDDTVICNGEDSPSWYRLSKIFGHRTVEWPMSIGRPPVNSAQVVTKPLAHNCDCWPFLFNVGRYGSWTKGVLSHQAYFDVLAMLA